MPRLTRTLQLTFASGAVEPEETLVKLGARLPVDSLGRVGAAYAAALGEAGVHSLGDLAELDPQRPVANIPPAKQREFRAKARLLVNLPLSPDLLAPDADLSVSRFLSERPEDLTGPNVTAERWGACKTRWST